MGNLLSKLKQSQKKVQKKVKSKINPNSAFGTLTDEEIALVLALRAKNARISLQKNQKEFSKSLNLSSASTYSNFEQKGTISLLNLIKVFRGLGRLNELENLLQPTVKDKVESIDKKPKQRVRSSKE